MTTHYQLLFVRFDVKGEGLAAHIASLHRHALDNSTGDAKQIFIFLVWEDIMVSI